MFNFNKKNNQEIFNKKMNDTLKELENLSYIDILARIAAFNKQSKLFNVKILTKKESGLETIIKNAGTIIDETTNKVKEKFPEVQKKTEELVKNVGDKVTKCYDNITVFRKKGDPWKLEHIAVFLKVYIKSYDENTKRYNPRIKERLSKEFSVDQNKLTNQANLFINKILYENEYKEIFTDWKMKTFGPTREEVLGFKFRDIKYCKDLDKNNFYNKLSKDDQNLLRQEIKRRNKS